mmetsp:Transcript_38091/g.88640  ORF Transcript_38091/g.88640 Transcript_38091/m.88640 type:complete len:314 (-) Transcript_38091:2298-3239(-)
MIPPTSSQAFACPCAALGFPPPLPPLASNAFLTHSSALSPSSTIPSGTTVKHSTFPPLSSSSSDTPMKAISGARLLTASTTLLAAFPSAPMSTLVTRTRWPWVRASRICSPTALRARSTRMASRAFLAAAAFFCRASMRPRRSALRGAEISRASMSLRRDTARASRSVSEPAKDSASPTRVSRAVPSSMALRAEAPVTAVIRRTPLATAVSSRRTNASASAVLARWVPPQNSTEASSPTVTTRTGSGYTSPKTARTPGISVASFRGMTREVTGSPSSMISRTRDSTPFSCLGFMAFLWEKSKRSLSALQRDPR